MTEHDIQNAIRLKLSELGFAVFRANVGNFQTADGRYIKSGLPKGFSDLFAVKDGRVFFIEVKTPTGRVSEEQKHFIAVMRDRYGCAAGVARCVDDAVEIVTKGV